MWHWMFAGFHPKYMLEITRVREIRICPSPFYPGDPVLWVKIFQLCGENTSQSVANPRGMQRLPHATVTRGPFFGENGWDWTCPARDVPQIPGSEKALAWKKRWDGQQAETTLFRKCPNIFRVLWNLTWVKKRRRGMMMLRGTKSLITTTRDGSVVAVKWRESVFIVPAPRAELGIWPLRLIIINIFVVVSGFFVQLSMANFSCSQGWPFFGRWLPARTKMRAPNTKLGQCAMAFELHGKLKYAQ